MFICINFESTGKLSEEAVSTSRGNTYKSPSNLYLQLVPLTTVVLWDLK